MSKRETGRPLASRGWHNVVLIRRAFREFALVPTLVVLAFVALAVVSIIADEGHVPALHGVRQATGHVIGNKSASTALQAIATGLLTVTSITFSVLLLAAQQTASNLSPVVFDQFVRRRINQVLLGFFVGLCVFAYLVMAAQTSTPPVVGAAIATLLTVVAMVLLLVLIYVTVDQMRPANVLRQIHRQTLKARRLQAPLRCCTLRTPRRTTGVTARYRSDQTGFVTGIDIQSLARALERAPRAEIRLGVTLGQAVTYGDVIATVYDDDEGVARSLAHDIRAGILLDQWRDISRDATTGVAEITNIAWTSGSTSKHSPQVARQGLDILKDLTARRLDEDDADGHDADPPLSVVYPDTYLDQLLDSIYGLLVVAHESHQHLTAAHVLDAYRALLPQAPPDVRHRVLADLARGRVLLDQLPTSAMLDDARAALERTVADLHRRTSVGEEGTREVAGTPL
ncbi:Predicted membrane protein [Pedococcus cremeus]|uniref:Predicted membrane protein n=1 Tax=Pedococcus cremeus TaxID=587636 RepID=A0A1H9XQY5_9MICO|nr:DUF2254 family protein [Pedococcus cremeus]SES48113.1 Predicted membrane protein [Pedococcus cremeus]